MKIRPNILIFDVPDRRSLPVTGSLGKKYRFHFLIPIHRGFWIKPFVELIIRILKPRNSSSIQFISFADENELFLGLLSYVQNQSVDLIIAFSERSTAILCEHAKELEKYSHIPFGTIADFNSLNDKYSIL